MNNTDKELQSSIFEQTLYSMTERKMLQKFGTSFLFYNICLTLTNIILVVLISITVWFAIHPQREYFASDNGRIIKLVPLSEPYQSQSNIIQFARDAIIKSFSIDFLNYQGQLEQVRSEYTRQGFSSFLESLENSNILDTITRKRMNMTVTANTGVLIKQGLDRGIHYSIVEIPIEIRLVGQSSEFPSQKLLATVKIDRISVLDSIKGIAISQLVTKPL